MHQNFSLPSIRLSMKQQSTSSQSFHQQNPRQIT
jgi:hypothetical protein